MLSNYPLYGGLFMSIDMIFYVVVVFAYHISDCYDTTQLSHTSDTIHSSQVRESCLERREQRQPVQSYNVILQLLR